MDIKNILSKIILVISWLIICFLLASCKKGTEVYVDREEYELLKKGEYNQFIEIGGNNYKIYKGSDGHDYFQQGGHSQSVPLVSHIGSCRLCNKNKDSDKNL